MSQRYLKIYGTWWRICVSHHFLFIGSYGVATIWTRSHAWVILCMRPANERRRYIVTSPLIGWAHTQNDHGSEKWPITKKSFGSRQIYLRNFIRKIVIHRNVFENFVSKISAYLFSWTRCINSFRQSDASKLTIIASDNGLSPDRWQAIIWTNIGLLLIGTLETKFSEILIEI